MWSAGRQALACACAAALAMTIAQGAVDRCAPLRDRPPADPYGAECFDERAIPRAERAAVRERLSAWAAASPDDPWLMAARMRRLENSATAIREGEQAAAAFAARRDAKGEAYARFRLVYLYNRFRRDREAQQSLERGETLLSAVDDPTLAVLASLSEMTVLDGRDRPDEALLVGRRAIGDPRFGETPAMTRRDVAYLGADVARRVAAVEDMRRFALLNRQLVADPSAAARLEASSDAEFRSRLADLGLGSRDEAMAALVRAYEFAVAAHDVWGEARFLCLIPSYAEDPAAARTWLERCVARAREFQCADLASNAECDVAALLAADPRTREEALRHAEHAVREARALGALDLEMRSVGVLAEVKAVARSRTEAMRSFEDLLRLLERLRSRLDDPEQRAALFSREPGPYVYAEFLALGAPAASDAERSRAFEVLEEARARELEDRLAANGVRRAATWTGSEADELKRIRAQLDEVRSGLQDGNLTEAQTAAALVKLDALDARESEVLIEHARRDPQWAASYHPPAASERDVRAALAPDEALVSFQVGTYAGATPWAIVLTRDRAECVRLAGEDFRAAAGLYRGLLERRDGSDRIAAEGLFKALFDAVLPRVPRDTRRLIVITDGPLCRIPLVALVDPASGRPLVSRFEIEIVPSATLWLRWKSGRSPAPGADGFGVADPELPRQFVTRDAQRRWDWTAPASRARLPRAKDELDAMRAALGDGSEVLSGREASERALKRADLRRFGVLHIAAHSVVNQLRATRSAILLAGGAPEDGLLEEREISALPLDGKLVVLSACSTAEGRFAAGEGTLSLTHAFLGAGARAVVSTLWPIRDDDAAALITRFYARLAAGEPVVSALAGAQRDRIAAGAPPAAWAAFTLVGDGSWALPPRTRPSAAAAPPRSQKDPRG